MKISSLCVLASLLLGTFCQAQLIRPNSPAQQPASRDTVIENIRAQEITDSVRFFSPRLPALHQLAGAPVPFYTYFWEFGDGTFSFDESPTHIYKDTGTYTVRLYATNNFDEGMAPLIKPFHFRAKTKSTVISKSPSYFFNSSLNGNLGMKNNRDPRPGEEFVVVIGYRNRLFDSLRGSLVVFFNEKQFERENFVLAEKRTYHMEQSSSLKQVMAFSPARGTIPEKDIAIEKETEKAGDEEKGMMHNGWPVPARPDASSARSVLLRDTPESVNEKSISVSSTLTGLAGETITNPEVVFTEANGGYRGEDNQVLDNLLAKLSGEEKNDEEGNAPRGTAVNYAGEVRSQLQELKLIYIQNAVFQFASLPKGEENFLFMTMNTLPDMIQDTNAVITMTAMLIPDNPFMQAEKFELQMQIVASHDPNRLLLKQRRINYRFMGKKKELTYQVRFQNTGKGPARKVAIGIGMPRQLNHSSLEIKNMRPVCSWCSSVSNRQSCVDTIRTADSIYFVFNNIYLPGMQQGLVKDKDSTKGFVEYSVRFKRKPKKIPFGSRAIIVFDKNPPIYTNRAMARFVKGISPGIVGGYTFSSSNGQYSAKGPIQIGYVLSPYAPSKPYFQVEAYAGFLQREDSTGMEISDFPFPDYPNDGRYGIVQKETTLMKRRNLLQLVPLHFRYNVNKWVGVGVGIMGQIVVSEQRSVQEKFYLQLNSTNPQPSQRIDTIITLTTHPKTGGQNFWGNADLATFADLQVGRVRTGPSIGFRYIRQLRGNIANQFFVYAGIKL